MDRALLDTDMLSELLKARDAAVVRRGEEYLSAHVRFTTSVVSVMEIVSGHQRTGRDDRLAGFLAEVARLDVIAFDQDAASLAGRIDGDLWRIGRPIGVPDTIVAGIALSQAITLVTGNTSHYQRIVDLGYPLRLENWREPLPQS